MNFHKTQQSASSTRHLSTRADAELHNALIMQLFVRCGAPVGTLSLECMASDTVGALKEKLSAKSQELGPCRFLVST